MRYYHRTTALDQIQAEGWRDATGYYMTSRLHSGVWISDRPLDVNEGASGDHIIVIELPADAAEMIDREHEWVEDGKPYREWLVPADLLNAVAIIVEVVHDPM